MFCFSQKHIRCLGSRLVVQPRGGASWFERWCADGVGARERKGKERKGRERKGKDGKGRERKGKEGKGWERKEKGRERKGNEGKGRERKGKE